MGSAKFTEPAAGASIVADEVGGAHIFGYREVPVDTWTEIDYAGVSTPGTAEQLAAAACKGFWVIGNPYNANPVAVGPSSSTKATATVAGFRGMPVYPGQAVFLPLSNTNLAYVDNLAGDQFAVLRLTHTDS